MKILVNLFHPHLDSSRVNRAWAQRLAAQPDITVRDIYALYPEGRIDIAAESRPCWPMIVSSSSTRSTGIRFRR